MPLFGKKQYAKKKSKKFKDEMEERLSTFATKEDIDKQITEHEQKLRRQQLWNSLTPRQKMKMIERAAKKKGV